MNQRVKEIIEKHNLQKHPEGGYYKRVYTHSQMTESPNLKGSRPILTTIYYLLSGDDFSCFHRFPNTEVVHYYEGTDDLAVFHFDDEKKLRTTYLGKESLHYQYVCEPNTWVSYSIKGLVESKCRSDDMTGKYVLIGCQVSPGFRLEDDLEMGKREELIQTFSKKYEYEITKLTRM